MLLTLRRLALRAAHRLRLRWWRLARPRLTACRVIAGDAQGRIVLIRHGYGSPRWGLPGGGARRGETPLAAAQRELREETGLELHEPRSLAVRAEVVHGARITVHVVAGRAGGTLRPDGAEVIAARWFDPVALPADLSGSARADVAEWIGSGASGR